MALPISGIPKQLNQLIAKLMAKNTNERYISAKGIKENLLECAKQWNSEKKIDEFPLGRGDLSNQLNISHKLYGREEQIQQLLATYEKISQGAVELMLVSGYSGVGKTSLVREVQKPMTRQSGVFLFGKFEQLQRNIPYHAFGQAFGHLIHQLLLEPEEKLNEIKREILEAIGRNGQVIIQVVPDVELLIGKQPEIRELQPKESQNRLLIIFQDFVRVFAQRDHPLVIFLDDLQWADSASLKLMELLLMDPSMQYLFIIGAYRDNEINAEHPLLSTLDNLKKSGVQINDIHLTPLKESDVCNLLMDSLHTSATQMKPLAELIYSKTGGNPFFINQFLKAIYREGNLSYNFELNVWQWDADKIKRMKNTDNVVELMIHQIKKLSPSAMNVLKLSSCIGNDFDLQTLTTISEKTPQQLAPLLSEMLQAGLILPADEKYKRISGGQEQIPELLEEKISFYFLHDRVLQAAYKLIPEEARQSVHLSIGRLLLQEQKSFEHASDLFDIMNNFSKSLSLITDKTEKRKLVVHFLNVGKAAKDSTSYQAAYNYLNSGVLLIGTSETWKTDYGLLFELYFHLSECSYLTGQEERANQLYDLLLQHAKDKYDKLKVYSIIVRKYANEGNQKQAFEVVLKVFHLFGIKLPNHPSDFQILLQYMKIKLNLKRKKLEKMDSQQITVDTSKDITLHRFWAECATVMYIYNVKMWAYLTLLMEQSIFRKNFTEESPQLLYLSSILRFGVFQDLKGGLALTELADKIGQKCHAYLDHRIPVIASLFANHLKQPVTKNFGLPDEAFHNCLENGDFYYAIACIGLSTQYGISTGQNLAEFYLNTLNHAKIYKRLKFLNYLPANRMVVIFTAILSEVEEIKDCFLEIQELERKLGDDKINIAFYYSFLFLFYYFLNDSTNALKISTKWFIDYRQNLAGSYSNDSSLVHYVLIMADHYSQVSPKEQKLFWKRIKKIEKRIKYCNEIYPANYSHMYFLLQAEMAKLNNNFLEAMSYYDKAIEKAKTYQFTNYTAVINERAGIYCLKTNLKFAKFYLQEAHYYYTLWGLNLRVRQLETQYPHLFKEEKALAPFHTVTASTSGNASNLDILSIIKSTQAISGEIVLERLLSQLIQLVLENAGAQRCILISSQEGSLVTLAEGYYRENKQVFTQEAIPYQQRNDLPKSLISYVLRTKENVIIDDIREDGRFNQDSVFLNL